MKLPSSLKPFKLSFELASQRPEIQEVELILDGIKIDKVSLGVKGEFKPILVSVPGSENRVRELIIEPLGANSNSSLRPCLELAQVSVLTPRHKIFRAMFGNLLGQFGVRFQLLPLPHSSILDHMATYDALWAISEYTQRWIENYWKKDSVILYPPIDVEQFTPKPKKNQILNVGRFFAGDHNKKHLVMIRAFKEMVDAGLEGWELHLSGGSTPGEIHQKYLEEVVAEVLGYPIYIHPDLPYPKLLELYNESAIYWHASGYGEDENRDPIKFEHFGITTVEGMAAGCVPVVIGKGGQTEIVHHGQDGFLWYSTEELKNLSSDLITNPGMRQRLAANAIKDSRNFSMSKFYVRVHDLLAMIGVEE
jgi:glycosyltransferase involved in cell wall biosynthesis